MALTSKKNNRNCIVCGQSYYFCNHCQDGVIKPSWYNIFHDQNCHDIYDAVSNIYPTKGKEAAKEALDKLDLTNKENFHPNIIKLINEIYDIMDKVENIENIENINNDNKKVIIETEVKDELVNENKLDVNKEENINVGVKENVKPNMAANTKQNSSFTSAKKVSRNIKNKK